MRQRRGRRWKEEWQWATYCIDLVKVEGWDVFGGTRRFVPCVCVCVSVCIHARRSGKGGGIVNYTTSSASSSSSLFCENSSFKLV